MMTVRQKTLLEWTLLLLVAGFAVMLIAAPGTPDTATYGKWVDGVYEMGLLKYYSLFFDYPPGTLTIFWAVDVVVPGTTFLAIKLTLLLSLFATGALVGVWQKNVNAATLALAVLVAGAMGLGYADILVAPFLVGSLWALSREKYFLAGLLFGLACAVKWQPIIFVPFVVLYVLGQYAGEAGRWKRRLLSLLGLAVPAALVAATTVVTYGYYAVGSSLLRAFSPSMMSGNALNFEWVLTWVSLGGAERVSWQYLEEVDSWMPALGRVLMAVLLVVVLLLFLLSSRTFDQLLIASACGLLMYFVWNINVHENHLFPAALVAVLMIWRIPEFRIPSLILVAIYNINLLIMYGLTGGVDTGSRMLGSLDATVPYSIVVCLASLVVLWVGATQLLGDSRPRSLRDAWASALK